MVTTHLRNSSHWALGIGHWTFFGHCGIGHWSFRAGLNLIVQPIAALGNPNRVAALFAKDQTLRTGLADETVGLEMECREVRIGPRQLPAWTGQAGHHG